MSVQPLPRPKDKPVTVLNTGTPVYGHNPAGQQICYRLRRNGSRCQKTNISLVNGRCPTHGGNHVRGPLHPSYIHGKQSKYGEILPQRYAKSFEQLANLKDWMSLREDIVFTSQRTKEIIQRLDDVPDPVTIADLRLLASRTQRLLAFPARNQALALTELAKDFLALIENASYERELHAEIQSTQSHLAKLIQTELRRREVEENSIPAYDAYVMFQSIIASIKQRCRDPHVLHLIANDLKGLTNAIRLPNTSHLFPEYVEGHPSTPTTFVEAKFEDPPDDPNPDAPIPTPFYKGVDLVPDVDPDHPDLPVPFDPTTNKPRTKEVILEASVRNPNPPCMRGNHSAPRSERGHSGSPDLSYSPILRPRKPGSSLSPNAGLTGVCATPPHSRSNQHIAKRPKITNVPPSERPKPDVPTTTKKKRKQRSQT